MTFHTNGTSGGTRTRSVAAVRFTRVIRRGWQLKLTRREESKILWPNQGLVTFGRYTRGCTRLQRTKRAQRSFLEDVASLGCVFLTGRVLLNAYVVEQSYYRRKYWTNRVVKKPLSTGGETQSKITIRLKLSAMAMRAVLIGFTITHCMYSLSSRTSPDQTSFLNRLNWTETILWTNSHYTA